LDKTIYIDKEKLGKNDPLIMQGDIFRSIPYFTYDMIIRSDYRDSITLTNEMTNIFEDLITNQKPIQVYGYYFPTWAILASQDCDIRPKKDLIFFPLKKINSLKKSRDIVNSVDNSIEKTTRSIYLPEIEFNSKIRYGPFEVIFHNPFYVPFEIIASNIEHCWLSRIIEPARKVFIGKLSQFYSRTPVDSFIFLDSHEITLYLNQMWRKYWKKKNNELEFEKLLSTIKEIKSILEYVNRTEEIPQIFFYGKVMIEKLREFLSYLTWDQESVCYIQLCNKILELENIESSKTIFESILESIFFAKESYLVKLNKWLSENEEKIQNVLDGKEVEDFVPINVKNPKKWVKNIRDNIYNIEKLHKDSIKYPQIFKIFN